MIPQIFYRYTYDDNSLILNIFDLVKQTPKGYWIRSTNTWMNGTARWIPAISKKRYAYPTKKEALNNYIHRSNFRISILINQTEKTTKGLKKAKKLIKTM